MNLLLEAIDTVETRGDPAAVEIESIELDSRRVRPGALFCCLPGRHSDGHRHAPEAVERGARALLVEHALALPVSQAVVGPGRARPAMARIACRFHGDPARSMRTVGVTGTNGKTTVTHLLGAILTAHGEPPEIVGTLDGARTTPEAPVLQARLADARDRGRRAAVLEVSSHALTESRVDGMVFDAAVFTNLTHDHLDHHGTMEAYFDAKASLFVPERTVVGVVNTDDPYGARLAERAAVPIVAFGHAQATDLRVRPGETDFAWRGRRLRLRLTGAHNVINALAAAATAGALGIPDDTVAGGLEAAPPVPGRFEVVDADGRVVVVDYAHTPDGLRVALESARGLAPGRRVVCVFGCGGDRDRAKRPAMGAVAAAGADVVVVTSDNPRGEDPQGIIADILAGIPAGTAPLVEPSRATAIERAMAAARRGDVVLIAGKGHETVIESATGTVDFDDRLVAAAAARAVAPASAVTGAAPGTQGGGTTP